MMLLLEPLILKMATVQEKSLCVLHLTNVGATGNCIGNSLASLELALCQLFIQLIMRACSITFLIGSLLQSSMTCINNKQQLPLCLIYNTPCSTSYVLYPLKHRPTPTTCNQLSYDCRRHVVL